MNARYDVRYNIFKYQYIYSTYKVVFLIHIQLELTTSFQPALNGRVYFGKTPNVRRGIDLEVDLGTLSPLLHHLTPEPKIILRNTDHTV